jgi:hypothetical protein
MNYVRISFILLVLNIEGEDIHITREELLLLHVTVPLCFDAAYTSRFATVSIRSLGFLAMLKVGMLEIFTWLQMTKWW